MRRQEAIAAAGTLLCVGILSGLLAAGVLAGVFLPFLWGRVAGVALALVSLGLILWARAWLRAGD